MRNYFYTIRGLSDSMATPCPFSTFDMCHYGFLVVNAAEIHVVNVIRLEYPAYEFQASADDWRCLCDDIRC